MGSENVHLEPHYLHRIFNSTIIRDPFGEFSKWFWNPDFWLPVNFTWEDIKPREDFKFPNTQDILYYPLYVAFIILFIRMLVTKTFIVYYIASAFRLNLRTLRYSTSSRYNGNVSELKTNGISSKMKWSESAVNGRVRRKRAVSKLTTEEKLADTCFLLFTHVFFCFLGFIVLHNKEWFSDIENCWYKYPYHEVDGEVWFYYIFALGFSLSNTFYQMIQPSRKDTMTLYVHHFCTQVLLIFSWTMNFIRVGSLVLHLHHCVDWLLLSAKLCQYLHKDQLKHILFVITVVVWIITRLVLYPFWLLRSALFEGPKYMFMPSAYLFYALLFGLLLMNIMWMGMMIKIIIKRINSGKLEDIRSSDEESEADEDAQEKKEL